MRPLNEFMVEQLDVVQKIMRDEGKLVPMLVAERNLPERTLHIMACPDYGDPDKKMMLRAMMAAELFMMRAVRYAFIMEMWFAEPTADKILPSENPNRREGINVAAVDRTGAKLSWIVPFNREHKRINFEPRIEFSGDGIKGALFHLFVPMR